MNELCDEHGNEIQFNVILPAYRSLKPQSPKSPSKASIPARFSLVSNSESPHASGVRAMAMVQTVSSAPSTRIPESMIAQQLRSQLIQFQSSNVNVINSNTNINDKHSSKYEKVCNIIITTFRKLYRKYIDSNGAVFMINIASRNRSRLAYLFDHRVCEKQLNPPPMQKLRSRTRTRSKLQQNVTAPESLIDVELSKYVKEQFTNKNIAPNDRKIIKWVVYTILVEMDRSAKEISSLMHDSFSRFRSRNSHVFNQLSDQIITHWRQMNQESPSIGQK